MPRDPLKGKFEKLIKDIKEAIESAYRPVKGEDIGETIARTVSIARYLRRKVSAEFNGIELTANPVKPDVKRSLENTQEIASAIEEEKQRLFAYYKKECIKIHGKYLQNHNPE